MLLHKEQGNTKRGKGKEERRRGRKQKEGRGREVNERRKAGVRKEEKIYMNDAFNIFLSWYNTTS